MTIDCWLQDASSAVVGVYAARTLRVTHSVYLATDPDLATGSRISVTLDGTTTKYAVRGVKDMAGLSRIWRLDVEEVVE